MSFYRQEAIDHKRRKLYGDVILMLPSILRVSMVLVVMFTAIMAYVLMTESYVRKEIVQGYIQTTHRTFAEEVVSHGSQPLHLQATLLVPTQDAGFVKRGQRVNLLIEAFPYQKFGTQAGQIESVSDKPFRPGELDAFINYTQPVYRVNVRLDRQHVRAYGQVFPLKQGMTLKGAIILERCTIWECYFTRPLART